MQLKTQDMTLGERYLLFSILICSILFYTYLDKLGSMVVVPLPGATCVALGEPAVGAGAWATVLGWAPVSTPAHPPGPVGSGTVTDGHQVIL